ncbi:uncharacterized protein [Nicotiana tomentosiformis]|uniref:uncharacterized protein n=1 Tax=Nicotiana tomentosiformis TaxID=4098 RepID=UPI00388CA1FA
MVEKANSRFRVPVLASVILGLSTGSLRSSANEQPTTSTAFAAVASHSSTPSASSQSSPTLENSTLFPPSFTLPSSLPVAPDHEEGVPLPQSPANFLAFEGLQRLIHEKEEIISARDHLLAEREQSVVHLSKLEVKATNVVILEARLQQSEQEVETFSREIVPLRIQFEEAKAKWIEVHNDVLTASDREDVSAKRLTNLEAALNSKTEEFASAGAKHSQLEEKYQKTIEHNRLFSSTIRDLNVSLKSVRSARESLSVEVTQLKEELKRQATSLVVDKTYAMFTIRRKTLEEAKAGIIDLDAEIAKAHELELATKNGLPAEPATSGSSGSGSETSRTEEEAEDENVEGHNVEPSMDLSTSPGAADTSLPPGFGDATV